MIASIFNTFSEFISQPGRWYVAGRRLAVRQLGDLPTFRFAFYFFSKIVLLLLLSFFATFFLCE